MASESLSRLKKLQSEAVAAWREEIVEGHEHEITFWQRFIRFVAFVGRSFVRNRCPVRASSLAYTTLLALIPVLAVAISISTSLLKGQAGKERVKDLVSAGIDNIAPQLRLNPDAQTDNRQQIADVIWSSIDKVESGTLGAVAGLVLIFIAVSLLSSIENTLNDIWGVPRGRPWMSRILNYWALITLGPILVLSATGLNYGPYVDVVTGKLSSHFPIFTVFILAAVSILLLVFTFAFFYYLMPNTKVEWSAAIVGGLVGGGLLHLNNIFSTIYFGQVLRNNKLWGSLGSVPVFLLGLYFSWLILLLGAQVAYAYQNRRSYFQEKQADNINQRGREFVAIRIMALLAERFQSGDRPLTACEIGDTLGIPSRLVGRILNPLLQTRLVVEIAGDDTDEVGYAPARPLETISYRSILEALRSGVGQNVVTKDDGHRNQIVDQLNKVRQAEEEVSSNISLRDLVQIPASKSLKAPLKV